MALTWVGTLLGLAPTATAAPPPSPEPSASSATTLPSAPASGSAAAPAAATGPTAKDDTLTVQTTGYNQYLRIPYLDNDVAGSAPIKASLTAFADDQPAGALSKDKTFVDLGDIGFVNLVNGGVMQLIAFGPTGSRTLRYRITDTNGASAEADVTVTVGPGGNYAAITVRQGLSGTVAVLDGDYPGHNADGTLGTIDQTSTHFTASGQPGGATVSADTRTLTVPGVGVFRADPVTGAITFVPTQRFRGPGEVYYVARDTTRAADGTVEHHAYRVALSYYVTAVRPQQMTDGGSTPFNASVTLPGVTNDKPGAPDVPLVPALTVFTPPAEQGLPRGSSLYAQGRGLKVPGQGWWTIAVDGTITFSPVHGFTGWTGYLRYTVFDAYGSSSQGYFSVVVQTGPKASPDTADTTQNAPVTLDVLLNDKAGRSATSYSGSMDPASVHFGLAGQPSGSSVSADGRTLTVPGQGAYAADRLTGKVTFAPVPSLSGTAEPVTYSARDTVSRSTGGVVHNPVSASITVQVDPITPIALDNWARTALGQPVEIPVLDNDAAGAGSAPLVPSSVRLRLTSGLPAGSQLSADGSVLTVLGAGTFVARPDGVVVFTPAAGFSGWAPSVGYQISDANGTLATASVSVFVAGGAVMRPTTATTRSAEPVVVDLLSNDDPPVDAAWDPSSVCVVSGSTCATSLTRPGLGTWTTNPDGTITVLPLATFVGRAKVTYAVRDTLGRSHSSTLTVTVLAAQTKNG